MSRLSNTEKGINIWPIIFIFHLFLCIGATSYASTTYYMPDDFPDLQSAFAGMYSGDTLIIREGVYVGSKNAININNRPPNGSSTEYTTIKAENTGEVVFDGENSRTMADIRGINVGSEIKYVEFEGISWRKTLTHIVNVTFADHIKFLKCSAYNTAGTGYIHNGFYVSYAKYILFEDCWSYGAANYNFAAYGSSAQYIIFRRCIARHDRYSQWHSQASFAAYDCKNVEFQNCIAIDTDQTDYYTKSETEPVPPMMWMYRDQGVPVTGVRFVGCIGVANNSAYGVVGSTATSSTDVKFENCILHVGKNNGATYGSRTRSDGADFDHCLIGNISGSDSFWGSGLAFEANRNKITNSIIYGIKNTVGIIGGNGKSDYNCLFNNNTNYEGVSIGSHDKCTENGTEVDPTNADSTNNSIASLRYPIRVEDGSDLDGIASDSGDIGPTILKKTGVSGTLWGEDGYNVTTSENLWPFPNENIIKVKMAAYEYDADGDGTLEITGKRGFAADGTQLDGISKITLTSYIWEYLGTQMPSGIYKTPPIVKNLRVL